MDLFQSLVLGVIQGITEWLPISSQGQVMVLAMRVFGLTVQESVSHSLFLHVGTLAAATVYFRHEIRELLAWKDPKLARFLFVTLLATGVTAVPSLLLLKKLALNTRLVMPVIGFFLVATGLLELFAHLGRHGFFTKKNAVLLGLAQGFSVLPGISRSGTTTSVLLLEGFKPEQAFRLSFLLSLPTGAAAEVLFGAAEGFVPDPNIWLGVLASFTVGYASIGVLLKFAERINFGWWCVGFGAFYLLISVL